MWVPYDCAIMLMVRLPYWRPGMGVTTAPDHSGASSFMALVRAANAAR